MDPLCDPLTTRPIQTGWEFTMEPYPSGQFGFIDDPDCQFGNGSVWTRTRTRSDGPEPLLTLNLSSVDSFSTCSDGTKLQLQWKGEGDCDGKKADIGYKSMPVVGWGSYQGIHLGTHPWTHTDIQCLRRQ
jgi:hypothetical protein